MEYLLQLLIEKIENSENQWKPETSEVGCCESG